MTTEFARTDLAKTTSSTSEPDRVRVIREGVASYLPDIDPEETSEWLESFDQLLERSGPARARYLMLRLLERSGEQRVAIPALTSTDYVNTIPTELEPWFPGDEDVERRPHPDHSPVERERERRERDEQAAGREHRPHQVARVARADEDPVEREDCGTERLHHCEERPEECGLVEDVRIPRERARDRVRVRATLCA